MGGGGSGVGGADGGRERRRGVNRHTNMPRQKKRETKLYCLFQHSPCLLLSRLLFLLLSRLFWKLPTFLVRDSDNNNEDNNNNNRNADFPLFSVFPLFLARYVLCFLLFHLSLSELSIFLCSLSVRRHAHVDFQLFSQKSSDILVIKIIIITIVIMILFLERLSM